MNTLSLASVNREVATCFEKAETAVCDTVERIGYCNESEVTFLLREHLTLAIIAANRRDAFAIAMKNDLAGAFALVSGPPHDYTLEQFSQGLVGSVTWHSIQVEGGSRRKLGATGGDFGIVLARPAIPCDAYGFADYSAGITLQQQGLLVQAKLKRAGENGFGSLTPSQKRVYKKRSDYMAILRYEYSTPRTLDRLRWSSCRGHRLADVEEWLETARFPDAESRSTDDVITSLGEGMLGTKHAKTIADFIAVASCPQLKIVIDWPYAQRPDLAVLTARHDIEEKQRLTIYEGWNP